MNKIVNLTQHISSAEQAEEGVFNLEDTTELKRLLTFSTPPTLLEMQQRAEAITALAVASGATIAMVGGAPYFMVWLENALNGVGIKTVYSFTERVAVENPVTGEKTSVFKHTGWVGM
jgi:hypothetical protein